MGTRSVIGVMHGDKCKAVYCHWDGYLDHNGRILLEHYDSSKANHLVALGDLSSLRPEIGEKHDFDSRTPETRNWCLVYGRDIGEDNTEAQTIPYRDYTKEHFEEYTYLFTPGKGWEVRSYGAPYWTELNKALETMVL